MPCLSSARFVFGQGGGQQQHGPGLVRQGMALAAFLLRSASLAIKPSMPPAEIS